MEQRDMMETDVCIAGGGPAGLMCALLLARRGVRVIVLEKHADFLRDFRGDTVHPSTLDVLDELGLGERFGQLPHRDVDQLCVHFSDGSYPFADFSRLRVAHPYLAFVPQWDLLEMLAATAERLPTFTLLRSHEVVDVLRDGPRVCGVVARSAGGSVEVRARLTIAADGRGSVVRARLGLPLREFGAPMDVLWFRLPRHRQDGEGAQAYVGAGHFLITLDRGDYWQVAFVIPKGGWDEVRAAGLPAFREQVARLVPEFAERMEAVDDWEHVKELTVRIDRLRRWHVPGALLIGDAAHAMSPVGGVGINLAVQDAVAAARMLARPVYANQLREDHLAAVQRRRMLPTVGTQLAQRVVQRAFLRRVLSATQPVPAPLAVRVLARLPALRGIPARLVGVGLRPEHVRR